MTIGCFVPGTCCHRSAPSSKRCGDKASGRAAEERKIVECLFAIFLAEKWRGGR